MGPVGGGGRRKYIFWLCVCSLRCPACNAHAPYCHMWCVQLYNVFPPYIINGRIFGGGVLNINCVIWFSPQLLSETFSFLRRNERDTIKNIYWPSRKEPIILVRFQWKLDFLDSFEKYSNFKIPWKSVQWKPSRSMQMDGQIEDRQRRDEANSRFSQLCNRDSEAIAVNLLFRHFTK